MRFLASWSRRRPKSATCPRPPRLARVKTLVGLVSQIMAHWIVCVTCHLFSIAICICWPPFSVLLCFCPSGCDTIVQLNTKEEGFQNCRCKLFRRSCFLFFSPRVCVLFLSPLLFRKTKSVDLAAHFFMFFFLLLWRTNQYYWGCYCNWW